MTVDMDPIHWRWLGRCDYQPLWQSMQSFTDTRTATTEDQLWFCEHDPVFTLGLAAKPEHVLAPGAIPVVKTDRGGEVTYHGPGQLMVYPLIDVRRARVGVRDLVSALENCVVSYCQAHGIAAQSRCEAPGVYVGDQKLASVGLRIRRGASYHGLAINHHMDLTPFQNINPCGFEGLEMTDLARLGIATDNLETLAGDIARTLCLELGRELIGGSFQNPLTGM